MSSSSSQMQINHKSVACYLRDTVVTYKYEMGRKQRKKTALIKRKQPLWCAEVTGVFID